MAQDRFVRFKPGQAPTGQDIETVLIDYVGVVPEGGAFLATEGRLLAHLPGAPSAALRRLPGILPSAQARHEGLEDRQFEVYIGSLDSGSLSVITRSADEFTSALADGFAALVARHWGGTVGGDP